MLHGASRLYSLFVIAVIMLYKRSCGLLMRGRGLQQWRQFITPTSICLGQDRRMYSASSPLYYEQEFDLSSGNAQHAIPSSFQSSFLQVMLERGFIFQCTDFHGLDKKMNEGVPIPAYLGFDATAKSLHVGSLLQIMILRHLQKNGHKPIVLVGGGTTKVGDPTGKDESRKLLSQEAIDENIKSLSKVFSKFITFGGGPTDAILVNNGDWLDNLNYLNFLRDYGRLFTINRMLTYESVKQRLTREQPLTFLEFNYLLLQSYDFVELFKRHNAMVQLGGSDQWGNIIGGVELGRKLGLGPFYGLTAPLITTSDGKKMGKSAAGAVWLNKELLSEYDYWQFWRNTADADVIRFLKLFTELPLDKIKEFEALDGSALNSIKVILADEATKLLHGEECLVSIHATVKSLFVQRSGEELNSLPRHVLEKSDFNEKQEISVADLLVLSQMTSSRNEGRRLIKAGGVKINDEKVSDDYASLPVANFLDGKYVKLSAGKKKHSLFSANII